MQGFDWGNLEAFQEKHLVAGRWRGTEGVPLASGGWTTLEASYSWISASFAGRLVVMALVVRGEP